MQIGDIYTEYTPELAEEANALLLVIVDRGDGTYIIEGQPKIGTSPEDEIRKLKEYLSDTDWTVIKCMDMGVSTAEAYPDIYQKRLDARARINELEEIINGTDI